MRVCKNKLFKLDAFLVAMVTLLCCVFFYTPKPAIVKAVGNASSIEDGAVYFIRSKANSNMVFDIPASNFAPGNKLEIYSSTGWGNQRFVLEKSFDNTYRIRPLDSIDTYLSVANNTNAVGNNIVLKSDGNYNSSTLLADKFYIEKTASGDSYYIKTKVSNNNLYLGLKNYNTANKNEVVQKNYDTNNSVYYEWIFEKTETLGVNVVNEVYFPANTSKWFLLTVPYRVNYFIETIHSSSFISKIGIHEDTNEANLIYQVTNNKLDNTGSLLSYSPLTGCSYLILITNLSNTSEYIKIILRPEKPIYI